MSAKEGREGNMYLQLFWTFFKLGLFTIGGGMAMIPLMQGIIVDQKKWMTEEEIVDCLAVSQGLPGVIAINMATYIGHYKKGVLGAIVATIGVVLPSLVIIIAIIELLNGIGDNKYVNGALTGVKAAATGLIAYSAYKVGKQILKGWFPWILAMAAFLLIAVLNVNAVYVIIGGMVIGLVYEHFTGDGRKGTGESEKAGDQS
ncbi:chromate transporter [Aminicella lysinilytica]|uniref:Chromate transporter n=1 Tax=Aminicella lysinilytica TaxID=433323 RepID=A0A4R6Q992_9FIRM|nr:chromate transporter [Aminicella lysinilytica]TDP57739.1 chromate transporter [Aminicella lysinilytica]